MTVTSNETGELVDDGEGERPAAKVAWKWFFAGFFLLIVVNLVRSWTALTHTGFFAEDAVIFSHYYDNVQPLADVGRDFFGQPYKTLVTSFFAWVIAHFDVRVQPYLYLWSGFAWGTVAACCFFCSGLIRSRTVLVVGPLLTGLVAMNHIFYYNSLIFIMYTSLVVLLVLFFYAIPATIPGMLLTLIFFLFLPWAGPYSAVVIPAGLLTLLLFWRDGGRKRWFLLLTCCSAFAYYLTIQSETTKIMRIKRWEVIQHYFDSLLDRIFFFNLFGHVSPWFWLLLLFIVLSSFILFRKDTVYIKNSIIMFAIIAGSYTLFYLSSKYPVYIAPKPCHRFISLFFWCLFLLYLADGLFHRFGENKVVSAVFALLLCVFIYVDNSRFPDKYSIEPIPDTNVYVQAIHTMEMQGLKEKNQYVIMRQYNHQHPFFHPWVQVGSRRADATQILYQDFPPEEQNKYISWMKEWRPVIIER